MRLLASLISILNTEIWDIDNDDYGVEEIGALVDRFIVPLKNAGMKASKSNVKIQWRGMRNYSCKSLYNAGEDYLETWRKIFSSQFASEWRDILFLVELLFCFPIGNAKLERLFSAMKRLNTYTSLSDARLEDLVRIVVEGAPALNFDVMPAVELWINVTYRRPNQSNTKPYATQKKNKGIIGSLSDYDEHKTLV